MQPGKRRNAGERSNGVTETGKTIHGSMIGGRIAFGTFGLRHGSWVTMTFGNTQVGTVVKRIVYIVGLTQ